MYTSIVCLKHLTSVTTVSLKPELDLPVSVQMALRM